VYSKKIQSILSTRIFKWLGEKSFAIYLVHMPIIVSLQSYLYIRYVDLYSINTVMWFSISATILCSFLTAHIFGYFDKFSINISHYISKLVTDTEDD
jgi:peptidoglycan/LPS O-acetylase OafA/YrhL